MLFVTLFIFCPSLWGAVTVCTGICPALVDDRNYGSNGDVTPSTTFHFDLANPALGGNLTVCGYTYGSPSASVNWTDNVGTNTWRTAVSKSDGTRTIGVAYSLNTAVDTLHLTATVSASVDDFQAHCAQFQNVATSNAVDGTPVVSIGVTGPNLSAGNITTTATNDLVFAYGTAAGTYGFCCNSPASSFVAGSGFLLLGVDPQNVDFAEMLAQGSAGSINPSITVNQASSGVFNFAAVAFRSASAGTAPSGIRVACIGRSNIPNSSNRIQTPCPVPGVNLIVSATDFDVSENINSVTDSESNIYAKLSSGQGLPQMFYAQNVTFTNSNSHYETIAQSSEEGGVWTWWIIAGADVSAFDGSATHSGSQSNAAGASCANSSNLNSTASVTPNTNRSGLVIVAEYTGIGPECAASSPGTIFDAWWYPGQYDNDGNAYGSSGFAHQYYVTNTPQTITLNWANNTASSWSNVAAAFKAPATSSGPAPPTALKTNVQAQ